MTTRRLVSTVVLWMTVCSGFPTGASAQEWSYDDYAIVLGQYVNKSALVNYKAIKAHPEALNRFVTALGNLSPKTVQSWNTKDRLAFWMNAYNALTLKAIVDHYPIQSTWPAKLRFPANSIQQIPGVKNKLSFRVTGQQMTLDHIKHEILRKRFHEPRMHMALTDGAKGSPRLLNVPYSGDTLDKQLDLQTRRFLRDPKYFHIAWAQNTIFLSSLFKWFGQDYIGICENKIKLGKLNKKDRAILSFIHPYLSDKDQAFIEWGKASLQYLKFDWSLNHQ